MCRVPSSRARQLTSSAADGSIELPCNQKTHCGSFFVSVTTPMATAGSCSCTDFSTPCWRAAASPAQWGFFFPARKIFGSEGGKGKLEKVRYITDIDKRTMIPEDERKKLKKITERFVFRINDYYLGLINWEDPDDPIRRLVIPNEGELLEYGSWDASDEEANYVAPGC